MIVDKELNSYMLNVQQNSLIIRVKGIKFWNEKWLCNVQKISVNLCQTSVNHDMEVIQITLVESFL
jgi:hypothetical protein